MRINYYSFKYVCVVFYLKIRFYCLTFSVMSNLNEANFITPNHWPVINAFWIRFRVVRHRFVKYRLVRYTLRFVKYRDKYTDIPSNYFVSLHKIFKSSSRHVFKTSSRHFFKTSSRRLQDQQMFAGIPPVTKWYQQCCCIQQTVLYRLELKPLCSLNWWKSRSWKIWDSSKRKGAYYGENPKIIKFIFQKPFKDEENDRKKVKRCWGKI